LTDETTLLYVLDVGKDGTATVEDVRSGEVYKLRASALAEWRVVVPDG
jgi:hypothetical protein